MEHIINEIEAHLTELRLALRDYNIYKVYKNERITFISMVVYSEETGAESGIIAKVLDSNWKLYAEI